VSAHALPDPTTPIWSTGTFLRTGSVVPVSVLTFDDTGTAVGLLADPTVIPPEVAAWAREELAHIPDWVPGPDVVSPHCGWSWPAPYGEWICTEPPGHSTAHEARGGGDVVLASAPVRKPSPRPRKRAAA
jgi:hypothetical protein